MLGDDLIGQVLRCVRGIDVNEDSVSIETMRQVCHGGPGHYLGHPQTLGLMQTEYIYPAVADRLSPKEWAEVGKPGLIERAIARKNKILAESKPRSSIPGRQSNPQGIQHSLLARAAPLAQARRGARQSTRRLPC